MQYNESRVHVHGGAGEVIVIARTDNIGVFKLLVEQRVGISSVAVVGCPTLGTSARRSGRTGRGCKKQESAANQQNRAHHSEISPPCVKTFGYFRMSLNRINHLTVA